MQVTHSHGILPSRLTEKIINNYESQGKADRAGEIRDQRVIELAAVANRSLTFRQAVKTHRSALPDKQIIRVYDVQKKTTLEGANLKRSGSRVNSDVTVNEAYDGSRCTYDFLKAVFKRLSVDNQHFPLNSYVHFGSRYNNAYWDGKEMVYGDGDKKIFNRFTIDLDIPAHEQAHALTDYEAGRAVSANGKSTGIDYEGEAGGINESYSDQIGIMVKQWYNKQTSATSNWLIGEKLLLPKSGKTYALRDMLKPGAAFVDHPILGTDSQIAHYADYKVRAEEGPVDPHDGSGIVNKAFAVAATTYGGNAWEKIGQAFFKTLPNVVPNETFKGLANKNLAVAKINFSADEKIYSAVLTGWRNVGVLD